MHGSCTITRVAVYNDKPTGTFLDREHVFHQVTAGHWEFRMQDRRYCISPGDLILLPPYLLHTVRPLSGARFQLNVCHAILTDPLPELAKAPLVVSAPAPVRTTVNAVFHQLRGEWLNNAPHRSVMLHAHLDLLLALYLRHAGNDVAFESRPGRGWKNVSDAVSFVQAQYHRSDLSADEIAHASGVSIAHFTRLFTSYIGVSPYRYLCRYRIERAKDLLLNSPSTCSEVAHATGHCDITTFSRAFRRVEGMPPTTWRTRATAPST